jgi:hypothetical protein
MSRRNKAPQITEDAIPQADETDVIEQTWPAFPDVPVDDDGDDGDDVDSQGEIPLEADPVDVTEQRRRVPLMGDEEPNR